MSTHSQRLRHLERQLGSARLTWSDVDEMAFSDYSRPAIGTIGREYAEHKALRRWRSVHGPHARPFPKPDPTLWPVLVRRELDDLTDLLGLHDTDDAFDRWLSEADAEGWPALAHATNYAAFATRLAHERARQDSQRGFRGEHAREWRRRNPGWRPGMTDDEALAFEIALVTKGSTP